MIWLLIPWTLGWVFCCGVSTEKAPKPINKAGLALTFAVLFIVWPIVLAFALGVDAAKGRP